MSNLLNRCLSLLSMFADKLLTAEDETIRVLTYILSGVILEKSALFKNLFDKTELENAILFKLRKCKGSIKELLINFISLLKSLYDPSPSVVFTIQKSYELPEAQYLTNKIFL